MKQIVLGSVAFLGFAVFAGTFPYAQTLTTRYEAGETEVSSFENPITIPSVNGGMQANEDIAVFESLVSDFAASDDENWAVGIAAVGIPQASLAMRVVNGALVWMGYVGDIDEPWRELTGVAAEEGAWQVKVEIDYTTARRVRYSVKRPDSAEYTVLRAGADEWLPLGGEKALVSSVELYGNGAVEVFVGKCAARPIEGAVRAHESFSMAYDNFKVAAEVSDVWGATCVNVTLKDANGTEVKTVEGVIADDMITADFTGFATPGGSYSYDIVLTGKGQSVPVTSGAVVDLFANIDWFGFANGAFVKSSAAGITAGETSFAANGSSLGTVTPSVASSESTETTVETRLVIDGVYGWSELPAADDAVQFAILLARDGNGQRKWVSRTGSGAWTAIDSDFTTDNGSYDVKLAFDYREGQRTATCFIRKAADVDYTMLLENIPLTAVKLNSVAVRSGDFAGLAASYKTTGAVPTALDETKSEIALAANTELDLSTVTEAKAYTVSSPQGKSYRLAWKDAANVYAKMEGGVLTVKKGVPANGMESFTSYVLGLNPDTATDKPYLKSEEGASSGKVTLSFNGIEPKAPEVTGLSIKYVVESAGDLTFAGATKTEGDTPSITVELPAPSADESAVRYYRPRFEFQ